MVREYTNQGKFEYSCPKSFGFRTEFINCFYVDWDCPRNDLGNSANETLLVPTPRVLNKNP